MAKSRSQPTTALVLSGGGSRGAYEAGVLHYLRSALPSQIAEQPLFQVYAGTSVGAINTAFLAATAHDPVYQGIRLPALWRELSDADVYRTDAHALMGFLLRSGFFTATNFLGFYRVLETRLGTLQSFPFKSILDTTPFVHYLRRNIHWGDLHRNVARGTLDAITICATHMLSGRSILFIEKGQQVPYLPGSAVPIFGPLSIKHVLASAAVPVLFPLVRIKNEYYGDGSLRQNTPLNPAIKLGARRVLIVSLFGEDDQMQAQSGDIMRFSGLEPTLGDISGQLLASLFLDKIDYDLRQLERINRLLEDVERAFGKRALAKLARARAAAGGGDDSESPSQRIRQLVIRPSVNISVLAAQKLHQALREEPRLTPVQRFFQKVVDDSAGEKNDLVSYLLFTRSYLEELISLGYLDAQRQHDRLVSFFSDPSES